LNKSEDEEIEDRDMNEAELADLFSGLFYYLRKKLFPFLINRKRFI
jgi:hypothetical protein